MHRQPIAIEAKRREERSSVSMRAGSLVARINETARISEIPQTELDLRFQRPIQTIISICRAGATIR